MDVLDKRKKECVEVFEFPIARRQGNSKANCADTMKTYVTLGPALGNRRSHSLSFLFCPKSSIYSSKSTESAGGAILDCCQTPRAIDWTAQPNCPSSAQRSRRCRRHQSQLHTFHRDTRIGSPPHRSGYLWRKSIRISPTAQ